MITMVTAGAVYSSKCVNKSLCRVSRQLLIKKQPTPRFLGSSAIRLPSLTLIG